MNVGRIVPRGAAERAQKVTEIVVERAVPDDKVRSERLGPLRERVRFERSLQLEQLLAVDR